MILVCQIMDKKIFRNSNRIKKIDLIPNLNHYNFGIRTNLDLISKYANVETIKVLPHLQIESTKD